MRLGPLGRFFTSRAGHLVMVGGGLMLLAAAAGGGGGGVPQLDEVPLRGLDRLRQRFARKLQNIRWLLEEWSRDGRLTVDEMAVLLTIAYRESGISELARSGTAAPDEKVGGAWGIFQFTRNTLQGLGFEAAHVWLDPNRFHTEAAVQRVVRTSAKVAVEFLFRQRPAWANRQPYLLAVRAMHPGRPLEQAREMFVAWQAGVGRRWQDIARVAPNPTPGTLGYVHLAVARRLEVLKTMRQALGLPPL